MSAPPARLGHARAVLGAAFPELAPELADALDGLACTFVRLIGALPGAWNRGVHEPDGYDGIGREVQYERLLLSEWLLADEAPDEFLRRASAGEHAFLALSRADHARARRCLVALDAGPSVLGLPRLAMMAALSALERRARTGGVEFAWTVLGSDEPVQTGFTQGAEIRAFLAARSLRTAATDELARHRGTADELWLLAAPGTVASSAGASHAVSFRELPGTLRVEAVVFRGGSRQRTAAIVLPPEPVCVRLLRDPFASDTPARTPSDTVLSLPVIFADRGRRLMELAHNQTVRAHCVPNQEKDAPGRIRYFRIPEGERLLGMNYVKRPIVVTAEAQAVHVYGVSGVSGLVTRHGVPCFSVPTSEAESLPAAREPTLCLVMSGKGELIVRVPLANGDTLLVGRRHEPRAYKMYEHQLGGAQLGKQERAVWLVRHGERDELVAQVPGEVNWAKLADLPPPAPEAVHFAHWNKNQGGAGHVAIQNGDSVRIAELRPPGHELKLTELRVPRGTTLIGLSGTKEPQLVLLSADRKTFEGVGRSSAEILVRAPHAVTFSTLCPNTGVLAFAAAGQFTLYDTRRRRTLWTAQSALDERPR